MSGNQMTKYWKVGVTATVGGYISVNAKDAEEAQEMVLEQVEHWGLDVLDTKLYRNTQKKYADFIDSEITHRENEIIETELISDEPYDQQLVVGGKRYNPNTRKWNEEVQS